MSNTAVSDKLKKDMEAQFKGSRTLEGSSKVPYYKVDSDGEKHSFRVLPGTFGESKELWFIGVAQHWIKSGTNRIPLYCPRMEDSPCAFCDKMDEYRELEKELKEKLKTREVKDDKAKYKEIESKLKLTAKVISYAAPRASYLINVVDRDDGNVKVFSAPKSIFTKIMGYFSDDGPSIFDLEKGHDFRVQKKKKGRSVEYNVELAPKESPVKPTDSGIEDTLGKRFNLEKLIRFDDTGKLEDSLEEGIEGIANGADDDDGHDDYDSRDNDRDRDRSRRSDDDEPPARSRRSDDDIPMTHRGDKERESRSEKSTALLSRMSRIRDDE